VKRYSSLIIAFFFFSGISVAENHALDSLKNELQKAKEDTTLVKIFNSISIEFTNRGRFDSAMNYAVSAKELAEKKDFKKGLAMAFMNIGSIYLYRGNYDLALLNDSQSLLIRMKTGDLQGSADSYTNMGMIHEYEGNYVEAMRNYLLALKLNEQAGADKGRIGANYGNIATIFARQGNYAEALKNYFQVLSVFKQIDDKRSIAVCYSNIGNICFEQHNFQEALKNYGEALRMQEEIGDRIRMAVTCNNIGVVNSEMKNYSEALSNYSRAFDIYKDMGDKRRMVMSYINIGDVFTKQEKYSEARKYLTDALQLSKETGAKDVLKDTYDGLAKLSEATGDYKNAYQYHKLFSEVKDSLLNENNTKQVTEMKTKYETEKKDKEILMLNANKEIQSVRIEKQKATVKYLIGGFLLLVIFAMVSFRLYNQRRKAAFQQQVSETEMKALLSQIDSHFISNTLVSIKNYLYNNDRQSSISVTDKFAVLMREVLANSRKKEITLREDFDALENYLNIQKVNHDNKFDFEIKMADGVDPDEMAIPPMMIQPFVENSIKHGFREMGSGGMIRINISRNNSTLVCTIEDNGIGREAAGKLKGRKGEREMGSGSNSPIPPHSDSHLAKEGLGMEVINERLKILNMKSKNKAHFEFEDLLNGANNVAGTRVRLFLPYT